MIPRPGPIRTSITCQYQPLLGTSAITLVGVASGYATGDFGDADIEIYGGSDHFPVTYTTDKGSLKVEYDGRFSFLPPSIP